MILICYLNPFESKLELIKNIIPEISIFGATATTILFALDDQVIDNNI